MMSNKSDLSAFSITPEPHSAFSRKATYGSKYDELFEKLPENARLKCPIGYSSQVAKALINFLNRRGRQHFAVRTVIDCKDGFAGVWWLSVPPATKSNFPTLPKKGK